MRITKLNTLTPSDLPPHKLVLKPNTPIILLRNLDPTEGLCNGTRLTVKSLSKSIIYAIISFDEFSRKDVLFIEFQCNHQPMTNIQSHIKGSKFRFACIAMTMNKAQGRTLDFLGIY